MTTPFRTLASWTLLALLLMQFVPLQRINPTTVAAVAMPEPVEQSVRQACYDCHSYETRWPRAAYVAPASWLISATVSSGRHALNFSEAASGVTPEAGRKAAAILRNQSSHQPLYSFGNPEAKLSREASEEAARWFESSLKLP